MEIISKYGLLLIFSFIYHGMLANQAPINADMIVASDGSGDFTSIQRAIDATKAFPPKRMVIYVKNGIYREKLTIPSWNNELSLIGEDAEKTIITYNDYFNKINRGRNSTFLTHTLRVDADDFYAENLTIINSAGSVGQAVALHVEGNRCVFKNCNIKGNQDTIYLNGENSNQYFDRCTIDGTTDFIFGSATAVFSRCDIVSKSDSYITAASTNKGKAFGFVFLNCRLTAEDQVRKVYLGRPWRLHAKTVFLRCELGKHIRLEGWHNWGNDQAESASFYAEYGNTGEGADIDKRVKWSHHLTKRQAKKYTPENILGEWISPLLNE